MTLLIKRSVEKPWGKDDLPAPFTSPDAKRIGEVWFESPPELSSILVKYIFTSEKLSVQVHPSDTQAVGSACRGIVHVWASSGPSMQSYAGAKVVHNIICQRVSANPVKNYGLTKRLRV